MKFFVLFILVSFIARAAIAGGWQNAEVILKCGDTLNCEVKFRKTYSDELKVRFNGSKKNYTPAEVLEFRIEGDIWNSIDLSPVLDFSVFAQKENGNLYKTWIKEVKCLCDNSYQHRKVWLLIIDNEPYIIKKRLIGTQLKNWTEFRERLVKKKKLDESEIPANVSFDEVPQVLQSLAIK